MKIIAGLILFGLLVSVQPAFAGDVFDGTKPLVCASIEALDCDPGKPCDRGIPEVMLAPQFLHIDFVKKEISGPFRTTMIGSMDKSEEQIVLQGYEQELGSGMGWTLALDRLDGKMRIALASWDATFIIFGACTSLP